LATPLEGSANRAKHHRHGLLSRLQDGRRALTPRPCTAPLCTADAYRGTLIPSLAGSSCLSRKATAPALGVGATTATFTQKISNSANEGRDAAPPIVVAA